MKVYDKSKYENEYCSCFMAGDEKGKNLVVRSGSRMKDFEGEKYEGGLICPLNVHNSRLIREIFPFTAPVSVKDRKFSLGLGDRLGLASPGHIRCLDNKDVFPVLAQQSIRELNLTGRTYDDVLADVTWAVLQEGYEGGYGADGDHLKTKEEVQMALDAGFTMITLDCSEYLNETLDHTLLGKSLEKFRGREVKVGSDIVISISDEVLDETTAVYGRALLFTEEIYRDLLKDRKNVDFELSVDETDTPTRPEAHFLVAAWLTEKSVAVGNIAPRFCGEFQKGIDYRGDTAEFEDEFRIHAAIAEYFGHRLSIHSGSDKFSVFPIIGKHTNMRCHVKTAGTNWLEALRCIASESPGFFREIYEYSLNVLDDAKKYYHIFTEGHMAPSISDYSDENLTKLLSIEESRQILHVTYGFLLNEESIRHRFFNTMYKNEERYYSFLSDHIGNHLASIGL